MPDNFKIKPTKPTTEALVIDPITFIPLKTAGEVKPKNMYWLAKINDGDAEIVPETTAAGNEDEPTAATEKTETETAEKAAADKTETETAAAEKEAAAKAKKAAADKKAAAKKTTKK